LLEGYRCSHGRPTPRARRCDDHELEVALAVRVQRIRPLLLGGGDVHAGGLDGGAGLSRGRCQSPAPRAGLWLRDGDDGKDGEEEEFY
jgi:hypothetical protein